MHSKLDEEHGKQEEGYDKQEDGYDKQEDSYDKLNDEHVKQSGGARSGSTMVVRSERYVVRSGMAMKAAVG